ncbi:amidase [Tianweitania sp. BSSL-BM11]|uniref:Amidase n=1 Tax=Tianweitania aestuarii TaxID=2814886 RepID=A0ABS5RWD4_9HYPH|nr:amidase [Tianweitania aestuarii]MBS9721331.1 amidase [Tianweitania aestuarii]
MTTLSDGVNAFMPNTQVIVSEDKDGPLSGSSFAVKDIYGVAGLPTGGGNPQKLAQAQPAETTAPSVQTLLDAGARFAGKTQTDELTFSLMGQNAHYPEPINSAAPDRVTGGSSSGSAAAVAAGLVDFALGSDTGGSIRAPASFCGLIGLRPTHGVISLDGAMPLAPSFDTFGWFARNAQTYEHVADVLLGSAQTSQTWRTIRLEALDALVLGSAEADEYARMVETAAPLIGAPTVADPLSTSLEALYWTFRHIQAFEAWQEHGAWLSSGDRGLGPGVKERFAFGQTVTHDIYDAESAKRETFRDELAALLGDDGLLVLPTVPGAAPLKAASFDDLQAYRERALQLLCLSGLSGLPQISIPLGTVHGAPFGLSLLGPAGSDRQLVSLASHILEHKG